MWFALLACSEVSPPLEPEPEPEPEPVVVDTRVDGTQLAVVLDGQPIAITHGFVRTLGSMDWQIELADKPMSCDSSVRTGHHIRMEITPALLEPTHPLVISRLDFSKLAEKTSSSSGGLNLPFEAPVSLSEGGHIELDVDQERASLKGAIDLVACPVDLPEPLGIAVEVHGQRLPMLAATLDDHRGDPRLTLSSRPLECDRSPRGTHIVVETQSSRGLSIYLKTLPGGHGVGAVGYGAARANPDAVQLDLWAPLSPDVRLEITGEVEALRCVELPDGWGTAALAWRDPPTVLPSMDPPTIPYEVAGIWAFTNPEAGPAPVAFVSRADPIALVHFVDGPWRRSPTGVGPIVGSGLPHQGGIRIQGHADGWTLDLQPDGVDRLVGTFEGDSISLTRLETSAIDARTAVAIASATFKAPPSETNVEPRWGVEGDFEWWVSYGRRRLSVHGTTGRIREVDPTSIEAR